MTKSITKHILIRLGISIILLLLLHFSQVEYAINANLVAMGFEGNPTLFIGSVILFAWIIFLFIELIKLFKNQLKWFAVSNIAIIILVLLGYGFINILIAVTQC